jgi:hypothetical protein
LWEYLGVGKTSPRKGTDDAAGAGTGFKWP